MPKIADTIENWKPGDAGYTPERVRVFLFGMATTFFCYFAIAGAIVRAYHPAVGAVMIVASAVLLPVSAFFIFVL